MNTKEILKSEINYCIIVPTYNNCKTLARVLDSILQQTKHVIVVNDGSTDATIGILKNYPSITILTHEVNSGKGVALQNGFKKALELGFDYTITIDSDGQHYPEDIPIFLTEIQENGEALLIGSRNMTQENVPKKSSFGNKFSNFWFWFETGISLQDTQSGYRLYPLHKIPIKFYTTKFEFEIEIIVRTAWKHVPIKNIPIRVLYDPSERVSHFRPFRDFSRISVLNTVLVTISLLYIKPLHQVQSLKKKGFKKFILENIIHHNDSILKKTLSVMLGVFVGISPFWGFQTAIVLFLAIFFKLNKVTAFAFSNISFPPFIPVIIYYSLYIGGLILGVNSTIFPSNLNVSSFQNHLTQYLIGSFVLATIVSIIFGIITYSLITIFSTFSKK